MAFRRTYRKILIPDVPPARSRVEQGAIIAGISVFCASLVIVAALFVFLGA